MSKLTHKQLESFVSDTLSKREPCPAMVLAWGWMLKQGEGGIFHGDSFKQRFFVLARVPHATVLIYYAMRTMDEEHILGFIDLRSVTAVRESTRPVVVDGAKGGGILGKLGRAFGSSGSNATATKPVVELDTRGRTFVLCPQTIAMPPPMTTAQAVAADYSKPLYLFGWPFPVPPLDSTPADDEAEVARAFQEGRTPPEAFAQWRDVLATAVGAEKATRQFPVVTLVDSTGVLPQRVILRTTPCELAIVSVDDKDTCFASVPYNDLLKWDLQASGEIAINARTRARLTSKADRSGFASQRPTRPTCHFVVKAAQAGNVLQVIDNHLRALAKQLAGLGDGADETDAASEEVAAGAGLEPTETEEDDKAAAAKLTSKRPTRGAKPAAKSAAASDDDEDEEEASAKPAPKAKKPVAVTAESDSDPEPAPKKPAALSNTSEEAPAAKENTPEVVALSTATEAVKLQEEPAAKDVDKAE